VVNALNDVMEAADRRLERVRVRVPGSIVAMLVVLGVFTTYAKPVADEVRARLLR
jgi:hypothetical protein